MRLHLRKDHLLGDLRGLGKRFDDLGVVIHVKSAQPADQVTKREIEKLGAGLFSTLVPHRTARLIGVFVAILGAGAVWKPSRNDVMLRSSISCSVA